MSIRQKQAEKAVLALLDSSVPLEHRKRLLMHMCMEGAAEGDHVLKCLLEAAAAANGQPLCDQKLKELTELLDELQKGPQRAATFIKMSASHGSTLRALIVLQDGEEAFTVVPNAALASELQCGDRVWLEAHGRALLGRDPAGTSTVGEEARLERRINREHVEVSVRDMEHHVYRAAAPLIAKLDCGKASPGCKLLVCTRRLMAFDVVPESDGLSHFRYLVRDPVPDVVVERDIGNPPAFIDELIENMRMEMDTPELGRRYRLRRSRTKLLYGVSGSGKTLSIRAVWRLMYELMSMKTGVPMHELPPRVIRLRLPQILSKWLGESDKRLDRLFDEVEQLAAETFTAPNGREYELPVLVICEEIEGLARSRGDGDGIYDRIQTTALERLDTNCEKLANRLVIFLFTTNTPALVDTAFLRRAGGTMEAFGRLDRRAFSAVLSKHVRDLPFREDYGSQSQAEQRVVRQVTDWLFSPNGHDPGQVQLTYVGSSTPVLKYRRDFLTGALVDRAVQQAAGEACFAERQGCEQPGLTCDMVIAACDRQIRSIVDQLTTYNIANHLTLPDGVRVGDVRRIPQPRVLPFELERAS